MRKRAKKVDTITLRINADISSLSEFVQRQTFAGYDPYDALNSPIARVLSFGRKYGRIAWIQLLRRLPVNLRPVLLVPKGHNPKALGLFLGGYAKLYKVDNNPTHLKPINQLLDLLEKNLSTGYSGNCYRSEHEN